MHGLFLMQRDDRRNQITARREGVERRNAGGEAWVGPGKREGGREMTLCATKGQLF